MIFRNILLIQSHCNHNIYLLGSILCTMEMPLEAALTMAREDAMLGLYQRSRRGYEDKIIPEVLENIKSRERDVEFKTGEKRVQLTYELEQWKDALSTIEEELETVASLASTLMSLGKPRASDNRPKSRHNCSDDDDEEKSPGPFAARPPRLRIPRCRL